MKWISIKKELPEESGQYLIRTLSQDTEIAWYLMDDHCERHFFKPRQSRKRNYSIDKDITHWMPLPKPPKIS